MNRADRLEAALRDIVHMTNGPHEDRHWWTVHEMARAALDLEYPWPGEPSYNAPQDAKIAHEWVMKHEKADEIMFIKGRPYMAFYYEPVAEHYQQARQNFRRIFEALRVDLEYVWGGSDD
jgi:hypothetical protein